MNCRNYVLPLCLFTAIVMVPAVASAQANDKSGLTLGVKVYESYYGPVISEFLPGYEGNTKALKRGDVIKGVAANGKIVKTPNLEKLVEAKALLGPDISGVMKIWRPNVGFMYPLVALTPDSGGTTVMSFQMQTDASRKTYEGFGDKAKDEEPSRPITPENGPGVFPPDDGPGSN